MTPKLLLSTITFFAFFVSIAMYPQHTLAESKKLKKAKKTISQLEKENNDLEYHYKESQDTSAARLATIRLLNEQLASQKINSDQLAIQLKDQKANNEQVLNHLKDLSMISGSQAESIKKFLETMGAKDAYIRNLLWRAKIQ